MGESMRAWQAISHGAIATSIRLSSIELPTPGSGEVRLKVHAASLNPIDFKLVQGALRRFQKLQFPVTIGFDACGVIDAVGSGVQKFRTGDRVFVRASRDTLGAFAEYSVQPQQFVALAPSNLDAASAASLPLVALTTVQGLVDRARVKAGQRILVHAGSGGLGSFAVQYAHQLGLLVDTTTSSRNAAWVKQLGATRVISYDQEDYRSAGELYDIVFDTLGGIHTLDAFSVLKPGGAVVSVAGPPDREMTARFGGNFLARTVMGFLARKVHGAARLKRARYFRYLTESSGSQLAQITTLVEQGAIRPVIDRVFAFEDCIAAFEHLMAGRARGKVVLEIAGVSTAR